MSKRSRFCHVMTEPERILKVFDVAGLVQGVGFRPAVFRLAQAAALAGWVQNRSDTVRIALEGTPSQIADFMQSLPSNLPRNARVDSSTEMSSRPVESGEALPGFTIVPSEEKCHVEILIPADLAVCAECEAEVLDPQDRRYGYAFTTCTNCGPRYTLVNAMPYDRERTTMASFPMCPLCRAEYEDPADRRFHAETIACPSCGPRLLLEGCQWQRRRWQPSRAGSPCISPAARSSPCAASAASCLAADAFNRNALTRLRAEKERPHKPFAVMAPDLTALRAILCRPAGGGSPAHLVGSAHRDSGHPSRDSRDPEICPWIFMAPDADTLGAMLPTSPLHKLLLEPLHGDAVPGFELLVMTSGNRRGEPICLTNRGGARQAERHRGLAALP